MKVQRMVRNTKLFKCNFFQVFSSFVFLFNSIHHKYKEDGSIGHVLALFPFSLFLIVCFRLRRPVCVFSPKEIRYFPGQG